MKAMEKEEKHCSTGQTDQDFAIWEIFINLIIIIAKYHVR